jgi:hypothetical protein
MIASTSPPASSVLSAPSTAIMHSLDPGTSNGSLECQSSALRSTIRDATWIWPTYVRCRWQRNIVSSFSP